MTTLNPFAETEVRETVNLVCSTNPYASPADTRKGIWDHWLFWTFMKWMGGIIGILILADVILLTQGNLSSQISSPTSILSQQIKHEAMRIQRWLE